MKMQKRESASPHVQSIVDFISQCKGLSFLESDLDELIICQSTDGKCITLKTTLIEEVIHRLDNKKETFLQVNFLNGKKVILTDSLIGFKPVSCTSLDMNRLPKVVTTPDLLSFIEVLEDSIYDSEVSRDEIEDVKEYFNALLLGAENVGFNLICERIWVARLLNHNINVANT